MLDWQSQGDAVSAWDGLAFYFITASAGGCYRIDFMTHVPGPGTLWRDGIESVDAAKQEAERCAEHVAQSAQNTRET